MGKTIKQLALEALAVQDACNLPAVCHGMARMMTDLMALLPNASTSQLNEHPVVILWADKIASLSGCQDLGNENVSHAYATVYRLAESQ